MADGTVVSLLCHNQREIVQIENEQETALQINNTCVNITHSKIVLKPLFTL
jgi:hypothetical protein